MVVRMEYGVANVTNSVLGTVLHAIREAVMVDIRAHDAQIKLNTVTTVLRHVLLGVTVVRAI